MSPPRRRVDPLRRPSAKVTIIGCIALLGTGLFVPGHAQGVVACDAAAVRTLAGCLSTGHCVIPHDLHIQCDASCGAECVYDFGPPPLIVTLRSTIRSSGPTMRFVGSPDLFVLGPRGGGLGAESSTGTMATKIPGIETVEGGRIEFIVARAGGLHLTRPVFAPGGTITVAGGVRGESCCPRLVHRHARLDVSGPSGGGTIRFVDDGRDGSNFLRVSLLAIGIGPDAPGGTIVMEKPIDSSPNTLAEPPIHRIDVSGATGGTVTLGEIPDGGWAHILARGRAGDGGAVTFLVRPVENFRLGDCWRRSRGRVRLDGRGGKGGSLTILAPLGGVRLCQHVDVSGTEGGGSVYIEAKDIEYRSIRARGRKGSPGGTVRMFANTSGVTPRGRTTGRPGHDWIDVRGAPAGEVEVRGENSVQAGAIRANATKGGTAAGTVYLGELSDPPTGSGSVWFRRITARSGAGAGGTVTIRGCLLGEFRLDEIIDASGGSFGGSILYQSRDILRLPRQALASGPGGSVRFENAGAFLEQSGLISDPPAEFVQYPNPNCNCTMTLAECMTPP